MTNLPRILVVSFLLAGICACESEPVEETVWDDQVKAMDKARDVEQQLMQRADQLANDLDQDEDEEAPRR